MTAQRWYRVEGETLYVFDHWEESRATGCSITHVRDLPYYRATFHLRKAETPPTEKTSP